MSDKVCDHTSVGMLVWDNNKLLLIERKKFPFGFAPPAGHVDGDPTYEVAAKRELREEAGLETVSLEPVLDKDKSNPCRRKDGTWHHWTVYNVTTKGELKRSEEETKQIGWFSVAEVQALAERTEGYLQGKISDEAWRQQPGLEPVWYEHLKDLKVL
jgi:ADP-ribose pyrophosphatase YjhB (NUDIX family)